MKEHSTKEHLLQVAKKIFDEIGITQTTMNILAEESGNGRRTLYRYFNSKEDAAYQVLLMYLKEWNLAQEKLYMGLAGCGIEQLQQIMERNLDYMFKHKEFIRFMGDFDYYFRDSKNISIDSDIGSKLKESFRVSDRIFYNTIQTGIEDGSINNQFDIKTLVATMTNVLFVFGETVALRGNRMKKDAGIDSLDMAKCQIQLYINALKN